MKKLSKNPDVIVISSYPEQGSTHGSRTVGVASYAKNTVRSIQKAALHRNERLRIRVLAEKLSPKATQYEESGIEIKRVWDRNSLMTPFILLKEILPLYQARRVVLQFELSMFGNPFATMLTPLLLAGLKLFGKEVTIVLHQVIEDFNGIAPHANMKKNSIHTNTTSRLIHMLYTSFGILSDNTIVFDASLKHQLSHFIRNENISVIPHGVESPKTRISLEKARRELQMNRNEFVILCFGYEAWYKGTDWIVRTIAGMPKTMHGKPIRLVIAGGENPNHASKPYYRKYIGDIQRIADGSRIPMTITGFVPEQRIGMYFAASDLVLLPYRYAMSASGPLAFALSYAKPFMISNTLQRMFETPDMKASAESFGIDTESLSFALTRQSLTTRLSRIIRDRSFRKRVALFSKELGFKRKFKYIGDSYYKELFIQPYTPKTVLTWKREITNLITTQHA